MHIVRIPHIINNVYKYVAINVMKEQTRPHTHSHKEKEEREARSDGSKMAFKSIDLYRTKDE